MKIVIVPATYNEKGNIEKFITILEEEVFPQVKEHQLFILVADDNSPDGTGDVVKELANKYKNLELNSGEKKGLGAAYSRAMTYAIEKMGADVVVSIDADLQHDPRAIPAFIKKLEQGYDIVTGTRYSDGGSMPRNWPLHRKAFSVIGNAMVRTITGRFGLHDWTGGFRAYRKEVFLKEREKLKPFSGYTFQVAALYKSILDGYKVGEVPIHFYSRRVGDSKIAPAEYIYNLLKYVITERIIELKRIIKFLFVGGTGFLVQMISQEVSVFLGVPHAIAAGVGAEAAILSNFFFNNYWTFKDTRKLKQRSPGWIRLGKFNATSLGAIIIQVIAVWIAEHFLGEQLILLGYTLPTRIVVLIPTIIFLVIPLNYLIYNKIIWKTQYLKDKENE